MLFGIALILAGCNSIQSQNGDQKDYAKLAEQLKQCDQLSGQSLVDDCRLSITEPLTDSEKEKLVNQLQAIGYYPQL